MQSILQIRRCCAPRSAASAVCRRARRRSLRRSSCRISCSSKRVDSTAGTVGAGLEEHFADAHDHVETDDVGELDRSHRHAEVLGGAIDQRERNAFLGGAHGFAEVRHQHAIDEEARASSCRQWRACRSVARTRGRAAPAADRVISARITSTSGMRATGLKKCRPISRAGCASFSASCSSTMLEVLVASTALGFICGSSLRVQLPLGLEVLEDGLDHDVGLRHAACLRRRPCRRASVLFALRRVRDNVSRRTCARVPWRARRTCRRDPAASR